MSCIRFSLVGAAVIYLVFNVLVLWFQVPLQPANPCLVCECATKTTTDREQAKLVAIAQQQVLVNLPSDSYVPYDTLNSTNATDGPAVAAPSDMGEDWGRHTLAVVVPFRDRHEELFEFAPHMHSFLNRQQVRHEFWVIDQADTHRQVGNSVDNHHAASGIPCSFRNMFQLGCFPLVQPVDNRSLQFVANISTKLCWCCSDQRNVKQRELTR